jgi:hypothetical protein
MLILCFKYDDDTDLVIGRSGEGLSGLSVNGVLFTTKTLLYKPDSCMQ